MSTETTNMTTTEMLLAVEDIVLPEISDVRPFAKLDDEKELELIEEMRRSIVENGQFHNVLVTQTPDGDGKYIMIAGRRRLRAISMHNLALSQGQEPLKVRAGVIDRSKLGDTPGKIAAKIFQMAARENLVRKDLNPMQKAGIIATIRTKFKWAGTKHTKDVASFLMISPASVAQHEKLLVLSDEIKDKIADGTISADAAFVLADSPEEKRQEILDGAIVKQREELAQASSTQAEADAAAGTAREPSDSTVAKKKGAAKKRVRGTASTVKARHVRAAAREVAGAKSPRSKRELIDFMEKLLTPHYGYPNGTIHMFVGGFLQFAAGKLSDRTLKDHFDRMVAKSPRGTPPPKTEVKDKKKASKPAPKK